MLTIPETTNRYEPQIEDETKHYLKIRLRSGKVQWNAVIAVTPWFLEQPRSFKEWKAVLVAKYNEVSGMTADDCLESGEISEDEAMAWWRERDEMGRPQWPYNEPSPADCF